MAIYKIFNMLKKARKVTKSVIQRAHTLKSAPHSSVSGLPRLYASCRALLDLKVQTMYYFRPVDGPAARPQ
jgi:hypothetical protein